MELSHPVHQPNVLTRVLTACRVCGSTSLSEVLDLGEQPLANDLRIPTDSAPERYPLKLLACPECRLGQLSHVVPPAVLYSNYPYYSGANPAWHAHCASLCDVLEPLVGRFLVEIASNDGTLLDEADRRGALTVGVEPARNFTTRGYQQIVDYWSPEVAARPLLRGKVDVLVACNVLGHVDDVHAFMHACALTLAPEGTLVVEVPLFTQLLQRAAFDTIYHEHVSYWSLTAMQELGLAHGLRLLRMDPLDVHGGSGRFWFARQGDTVPEVYTVWRQEHYQLRDKHFDAFCRVVTELRQRIAAGLAHCQAAYGAAAKTTVLLNAVDPDSWPARMFDDSPHKAGKLVPGTRLVIEPPAKLSELQTLAITAWNWAPQLKERARKLGFRGQFFIPLPNPRWEDACPES